VKQTLLLALACLVLPAQTQDPAADPLEKAYRSLSQKKYLEAIEAFHLAVKAAPDRASIRKDLGYAYLKVGETESARELFEQALALDSGDQQAALEAAFLSHETGREARALELLEKVKRFGDPQAGKTAEEAWARIDGELRRAIERWTEAVAQDPSKRAARLELARNLEKHRQPARAAEQYLAAWRLPPRRDETLLELARARHDAGDAEGAVGAWLVASRSPDTRMAERARARLPSRHPYSSEFRRALELDPNQTGLRRDLVFLWLVLGDEDEAVRQLEILVGQDPNDMLAAAQLGLLYVGRHQPARARPLLEKVAKGPDPELARRARQALQTLETRLRPGHREAMPHKRLGEKSLALSYLRDALREFRIAHEIDPHDPETALQLGIINNILRDDREAVRYFALASRSPDETIAAPARRGYRNLAPQFERFQTRMWSMPLYSTRFHDAFLYGQLKTEIRLGDFPLRPYLSLRLVGDWRRSSPGPSPQLLSESSLIGALGLRTPTWAGLTLWAEAGEAASYLRRRPPGVPRLAPDYRGGISWAGFRGASLGGEAAGLFAEANVDAVYLSRFRHNVLAYWQVRPGIRLPRARVQLLWNAHATFDRRREDWANFVEYGPGIRFRVPGVSPPLDLTVSALRGLYLLGRPPYYDLRIGFWYAR